MVRSMCLCLVASSERAYLHFEAGGSSLYHSLFLWLCWLALWDALGKIDGGAEMR